ncbi:MAG: DNA alkylation repair protein [Bryobacterales bacterium]|nr:DNA alkylation repair protein [Bryobacterales bacterium]
MTIQETLATLESMGTAQNRKVYARHGAGEPLFGVSFANLGALKKKIKVNHTLARDLWATGNFDARVLATMIADPAQASAAQLESWVEAINGYPLADAVSRFTAATPLACKTMERWMKSKKEYVAQTGWQVFAQLSRQDGALTDEYALERLTHIETHIHKAQNRVRHAMNSAVIAVGLRGAELQKLALAAAARIGKVTVDHGQTGCETPDAAAYIRKAAARAK